MHGLCCSSTEKSCSKGTGAQRHQRLPLVRTRILDTMSRPRAKVDNPRRCLLVVSPSLVSDKLCWAMA